MIARALTLVPDDSHESGRLLSRYGLFLGAAEGDYEGAQQAMGRAIAIARREGDVPLEVRPLTHAADVNGLHTHWQESIDRGLRAIELATRVENPYSEGFSRFWAALSLLHTGDLDFYKVRYRHQTAYALSDTFTFSFKGRLGYGDSYGDSVDLPIFEKFTAGGVRSVRGYEFNSLGPLDSTNDPFGGNLQVITTAEVLFPLEALGSSETFRLGVYFDAGNVFADADSFESDELRQSVGLSAKWFSVIGPIEFSYAFPINDESDPTATRFADQVERFQFEIGGAF